MAVFMSDPFQVKVRGTGYKNGSVARLRLGQVMTAETSASAARFHIMVASGILMAGLIVVGVNRLHKPPSHEISPDPTRCSANDLQRQGFSGTTNSGEQIRFLGKTDKKSHQFYIYSYVFNNPVSMHGTHRLLLFGDKCRFLGSYTLDDDADRMIGNTVIFGDIDYPPDRATFDKADPPKSIVINGTYAELER